MKPLQRHKIELDAPLIPDLDHYQPLLIRNLYELQKVVALVHAMRLKEPLNPPHHSHL